MEERVKIITPGTCDYFRKVTIPSSLGDDTGEYAPQNGAYRNALVEYVANGAIYIYSSDGIYTKINSTGGSATSDFNSLTNRPKYKNSVMTGSTNIPEVKSYTAGSNIQITNDTISATDTTYSNFTGTDGGTAGTSGLVPAPATTDAGKFLKADGTWDTAGGGGEIKVLTSADYNWNSVAEDDTTTPFDSIALWLLDTGTYQWDPSIIETYFNVGEAVPLNDATQLVTFTIGKEETRTVEGTTAQFSPIFMVVLDSQSDFDKIYIGEKIAVAGQTFININELVEYILNKAEDYVQYVITYGNGAPSSSTIGTIGRLYEDKTNGKLYICTSDFGGTYTWTEVGASGAGVEFIDLSPTSVSDTTINVTSPKTTAEIEALAATGKNIIFRIYVSQTIGGFLPGYYYIPSIWISSSYVWGSGIMNGGEFMYRQTSTGGYSGTIELREISPTEFTTNEWNALWA